MSTEIRLLLRDLRQAQELSQDELARQLGISRQSIISLEQGAYLPSFPLLINMIQFFNCSLDELVEGFTLNDLSPRESHTIEKSVSSTMETENINNQEGGEQKMQLIKYDPFQAIDQLHDEMNSMVERTFGRVDWPRTVGSIAGAINIHETDTEYELEIQVPGFKENELNLEFSDDTLTVSGEKKVNPSTGSDQETTSEKKKIVRREWEHSSFKRSIRFAQPIKDESVEAKLADGTLTIHAPKVEPVKPKVKKIEVKK